jgi:hypothetical protein
MHAVITLTRYPKTTEPKSFLLRASRGSMVRFLTAITGRRVVTILPEVPR